MTATTGAAIVAALSLAACAAHTVATERLSAGVLCVNYGLGARCIEDPTPKRAHALNVCAAAQARHRINATLRECEDMELRAVGQSL